MSANIYEKPNVPVNARYSKGAGADRGERIERRVEIYESLDTSTEQRVNSSTQDGGANARPPAVQGNAFRAAAVILGLLCLVLVTGIVVLFKLYTSVSVEMNLRTQLQTEVDELRRNINDTLCPDGWERFRCSCYYRSTEKKSWADSRADCQNKTAELVVIRSKEEDDFVSELNKNGTSWIGLQSVKTTDWPEKWDWKWVDGSTAAYMHFPNGQSVTPENRSTMSIDQQGNWITSIGSKQWICEKEVS